jgi:hypothetical protein
VPALVMSLVVLTAVRGSICESSFMQVLIPVLAARIPTVSKARRHVLATQATFWLLVSPLLYPAKLMSQLVLCVVWALLVSSLEFATQALSGEAQQSRAVSDGSVYSCE